MNDGLSRLYRVDEQREKKNRVSEIKVAIFQTMSRVFVRTVHFFLKVFDAFVGRYHKQLGLGLN